MDQKNTIRISTTILIEPKYFETNTKQYKRGQYNTSQAQLPLLVKSLCQTPLFFIPSGWFR
jgi:hypothetical protein